MRIAPLVAAGLALVLAPSVAVAWGDEGHEVVGEVALHFLTPSTRARVFAILAADTSPSTAHDFVTETTWADRYRSSSAAARDATQAWHFTDIEVAAPDIETACFGMRALPAGVAASAGPAADCAIDKIDQFVAELASPSTTEAERLSAVKFLMHFVGDLHQPLHSSDENDRGGNNKKVSATGLGTGQLHGFWDTQFVRRLGDDPIAIGDALAAKVGPAQVEEWSKGRPSDWALEAFEIAKTKVYGKLPKPNAAGVYVLPATYVKTSKAIVTLQLSRAGVRLARLLNGALTDP